MRFDLDESESCIDPDGSGPLSTGESQFLYPYDVAVDSSDNVYVADNFNNRIQKFDSNGNFITKWGSNGTYDCRIYTPAGLTDLPDSNELEDDLENNVNRSHGEFR